MLRLAVCVLAVCQLASAYTWYNVTEWGTWPDDMVFYKSSKYNQPQGICRYADWSAGRSMNGYCWTPWSGKEYAGELPWEALVAEPEKEILYWKKTLNLEEIRAHAVLTRPKKNQHNALYVCAVPDIGPGKLVVFDNNKLTCYVGYKGKEKAYQTGYQVLMVEDPNEYIVTNVQYHLDELKVLANKPLQMAETTIRNNDDSTQVIKRTLSITKTRTSNWEHGLGIGVAGGITVNAGIPIIMHTKWTVGGSAVYNYTIGKSFTETFHDSLEAFARVPAGHQCTVRIVARELTIDVPYNANLRTTFEDGTSSTRFVTGYYSGVSVNQEEVLYEKCVPYEA